MLKAGIFLVQKAAYVIWLFVVALVSLAVVGYLYGKITEEMNSEDGALKCSIVECEGQVSLLERGKRELETQLKESDIRLEQNRIRLEQIRVRLDQIKEYERELEANLSAFKAAHIGGVSALEWSNSTRDEAFKNHLCQVPGGFEAAVCKKRWKASKEVHEKSEPTTAWGQLNDHEWKQKISEEFLSYCKTAKLESTGSGIGGAWGGAIHSADAAFNDGRFCLGQYFAVNSAMSLVISSAPKLQAAQKMLGGKWDKNSIENEQNSVTQDHENAQLQRAKLVAELESQDVLLERAYLARDEAYKDPVRFGKQIWANTWAFLRPFVFGAFLIVLWGLLGRPLAYFTIAPIVAWIAGGLRISRREERPTVTQEDEDRVFSEMMVEGQNALMRAEAGERQRNVLLEPDQSLWVRPEYVVSSYKGGSTLLYGGWKHPIQSFVSGLTAMTRFDEKLRKKVVIGATGDDRAFEYVGALQLKDHSGFVVRPSHVVAILAKPGELKVHSRWSFGLQALLRLQIRYIYVTGTGTLYFRGNGGVFPQAAGRAANADAEGQAWDQIKDSLLVGWDPNLSVHLRRNENVFNVAFLNRDSFFETGLQGEGLYLQAQSEARGHAKDPAGRMLEAIFNAVGKVLGL